MLDARGTDKSSKIVAELFDLPLNAGDHRIGWICLDERFQLSDGSLLRFCLE